MALVSSVIVAGLLGRFVAHLRQLGSNGGSKVIYTLALSGISIFFALIFLVPLKLQFWAFPFDFAMFVMWIVAFGLLTNVRLLTLLHPFLTYTTNLGISFGNLTVEEMRRDRANPVAAESKLQRLLAHLGLEVRLGLQQVQHLAHHPRLLLHRRHGVALQRRPWHVPVLPRQKGRHPRRDGLPVSDTTYSPPPPLPPIPLTCAVPPPPPNPPLALTRWLLWGHDT